MIEEPISNPPSQPSSPVTPPSEERPGLGAGELAEEPRPFSLGPEAPKPGPGGAVETERPSPMEVARDSARQQGWSPEAIQNDMEKFQAQLADTQKKLQNPNVTKKLEDDHYTALNRLTEKINPDLKQVAKYTDTEFNPPTAPRGGGVLEHVLNWVGGAQDMMKDALNYAGSVKNPNPADMLRLQFAMHRATERGELFASIIGSTVSGIKTIMSAQLG